MIIRLLKSYFGLAVGVEMDVDATTANWMFTNGFASIIDYENGVKKVSVELTRPANTTTYDAGDAILSETTAVKQKETLTLAGTFGTATITGAGGLTKTVTFATSLTATATAFAAANAAAYLAQGIVLTSSNADLIFEAQTVGVSFTPPVITNTTSDLTGTVAHVTANVTAVKQKETISLLGETGTSVVTLAGGLTKTVTFRTDLTTTASDFVTAEAADYLAEGIVLTSNVADLIFEANVGGTTFVAPLISGVVGNLEGTVTHTTANRAAVKQKDTLTVTGNSGTAVLTGLTAAAKTITFTTSLTVSLQNFVTANAAEYLTHGVVLTSNVADLIFEANVAGVAFTHPVLTFTASDLDGTVVNTTANRVAVKQKNTLSLTGVIGTATLTGITETAKTITFDTSTTITASNFVTANAAVYLAAGVVLTSADADLIFEANVAGVAFTEPVLTYTNDLTGSVVNTTANRVAVAQIDIVTISGTTGTADMTVVGGLTKTITFTATLKGTVDAFVVSHAAAYTAVGITVTAGATDTLIFTADVAGTALDQAVVNNASDDLAGFWAASQANVTAVKKKDTITTSGTAGYAQIAVAGGLTKTLTFNTDLSTTNSDFVTAYAADYLAQGIVVTSSTVDLIFEANVAGTDFTSPTIANLANIQGTWAQTQVNVVAVKKKDTITLSGTAGHAHIAAAGGLTTTVSFISTLTQTAAAFVDENAASYLSQAIVVTSSGADIIFEAEVAGTTFTSPTITGTTNIQGTWVATTANVTAIAQVETIAVSGTSGYILVDAAGGLSKYLAYITSAAVSIDAFISTNAALYTAQGITLSRSSANLVLTAAVAGTAFTAPTATNTPGLRGTVAHTTANRIAVKQVETITNSGTTGQATIAAAGGLTLVSTFHTDARITWADFVTANAAAYDAQGIILTSTEVTYDALGVAVPLETAVLTMTAKVAGTGFTAPTITTKANISGTVVATTANVSLTALEFTGASKQTGVGSQLIMVKAATDMTMFASKTIRLWFFSSNPTLILGDNIAYLNKYANAEANDFYVDIVFDAQLSGSDMVYGKALPIVPMPFGSTTTTLYCLIQSIDGATTPSSGGKIRLNAYFK